MVDAGVMDLCDGECGDPARVRPVPDVVRDMDIFLYQHIADFTDSFLGFIIRIAGGGDSWIKNALVFEVSLGLLNLQ